MIYAGERISNSDHPFIHLKSKISKLLNYLKKKMTLNKNWKEKGWRWREWARS
jgi:ribosomal protein S15P/S13E